MGSCPNASRSAPTPRQDPRSDTPQFTRHTRLKKVAKRHYIPRQSTGIQANVLRYQASKRTPSPFPPVAPARARSLTPDSPDSDSPRPLAYLSKVRTRRGDQRMCRHTCAPKSLTPVGAHTT
jgi:hypothetical protein